MIGIVDKYAYFKYKTTIQNVYTSAPVRRSLTAIS